MWKISLSIIILYLSLIYACQLENANGETGESDNNYDILILSQEWPVTICKYWIYDLNRTGCHFPDQKNRWTIHGIWPAKFNAEYNFCNTSWEFDPEEIKSIEDDLLQAWTPTYDEPDPYAFWRHEWLKHGSCATDLESFNSQFKYFSKGIELNKKYPISDMLEAANLFPDDSKEYDPEVFVNAVKATTGKTAQAGCYKIEGVVYLQELRICFDKQLNMIDCRSPAVSDHCGSSVIFPADVVCQANTGTC
ncbi:hypothetical protein PYW07_002038 [Mythimna separata]|uniref:Uncharacterized protein n=1 Tax=Mythimna separata TaxID=271217 RepID=A0AAD7YMI5_MYTSE|nr:hypothetical protein PYW07_002038 [Mythimna separata]